jgi:YD repeat-containing protein
LVKPRFLIPLILILFFLLFAGIFAITQESSEEESGEDGLAPEEFAFDFLDEEGEEPPLEWIPPGPPRWFRSNAGGMALEEIPSRLSALRNKYALVIDYMPPHEIDPRLQQYYYRDYSVEIRILFKEGEESRRQWLFRDEAGIVRLNAVFKPPPDETNEEQLSDNYQTDDEQLSDDYQTDPEEAEFAELYEDNFEDDFAELGEEALTGVFDEESPDELEFAPVNLSEDFLDEGIPNPESAPVMKNVASTGFIEIFNEKTQIIEDHWLYEDDSEFQIFYSYNENTMVKSEAYNKSPDLAPVKIYTDSYRYNRSFSLRHVERLYHGETEPEPVRLTFPSRVLEAAKDQNFLTERLYLSSEFFGASSAGEGFRMVFETDGKGRILTQSLLNSEDEELWVIINTWSGDRIISTKKTEDEDEKLTEYEYDGEGNRLVQRDIHNGEMERVVYTDGARETEELYMNGVMVMKAYWENGRKISEERVRRR